MNNFLPPMDISEDVLKVYSRSERELKSLLSRQLKGNPKKPTFTAIERQSRKQYENDMMMVKNDIVQYNQMSKLSILDYYAYVEAVNKNISKMAKQNGKS
jgi:hypothetical protein